MTAWPFQKVCAGHYYNHKHKDLFLESGESAALLEEIQDELPVCPRRGWSRVEAGPECPSRGAEMQHRASPLERRGDPCAIRLEHAVLNYEEST